MVHDPAPFTNPVAASGPAGSAGTAGTAAAAAPQSIGELFFVGNATVLLKYGPFTVLTDPNFLHRGQRAYLGHGLTSRRLTEPALRVDQLPPLDAVVLSHLHGDHWDRVARRNLDSGVPIVTTPHASRRLQGLHGFRRAVGLRTWEQHSITKGGMVLRITSAPGRHAPGPIRHLLPPVMGSVLELTTVEGDVRHRLYITGDTLMYPAIEEITRRFPDTDLALLHLGGTTLPGGMVVTMDAQQGADLLGTISPRRAVPIHYDDYDVMRSPLSDFRTEVERRGLADRVSYVGRGESLTL